MSFEENLIEFIKKYEGLSKTESKLFGEVFTSQTLIEEMLDTLPTDVWTNKDLKWLDSSVGIGNFPAAILQRLMKGLEEIIPDELERRKWILEEMIYMGDISTKNLFILYQLFDVNDEFKLNVFRGDFLSEKFDKHMKEVWGIEKFDIVIGNPPYQKDNQPNVKLWPLFVIKSFDILKQDGHFTMLFPYAWTIRPTGQKFKKVVELFKKKYLNLVSIDKKKKWFNIGEVVNYVYLLNQNNKHGKTLIFDNLGNKEEVLYEGQKLLQSEKDKLINGIKEKSEKRSKELGKLPFYEDIDHNTSKDWKFKNNIISKEYKDGYSKIWFSASQLYYTPIEIDKSWRVFINLSGHFYHDKYPNKYQRIIKNEGNSTSARSILCDNKEQAENILSYTSSKLYRFLNDSQKTSGFNGYMIQLPFLDKNKKYTDQELYEYFNLTPEEIQLIEETVSEPTKKKSKKK